MTGKTDYIINRDALFALRELPDESVHCAVTSPPYYALRDYGLDAQIGREDTPEQYIERLVAVFHELKRVLRSDGTFWLNIADTYCGTGSKGNSTDPKNPKGRNGQRIAVVTNISFCLRSQSTTTMTLPPLRSLSPRPQQRGTKRGEAPTANMPKKYPGRERYRD